MVPRWNLAVTVAACKPILQMRREIQLVLCMNKYTFLTAITNRCHAESLQGSVFNMKLSIPWAVKGPGIDTLPSSFFVCTTELPFSRPLCLPLCHFCLFALLARIVTVCSQPIRDHIANRMIPLSQAGWTVWWYHNRPMKLSYCLQRGREFILVIVCALCLAMPCCAAGGAPGCVAPIRRSKQAHQDNWHLPWRKDTNMPLP